MGINVAFAFVIAVVAVGRSVGNALGLPLANNSASDLGLLGRFLVFCRRSRRTPCRRRACPIPVRSPRSPSS